MTTERSTLPLDEHSSKATPEPARMEPGAGQPVVTTTGETVASKAHPQPQPENREADERWQDIQAHFVDDPRRAVSEAHELVSELIERAASALNQERDELQAQWSPGNDVSTEGLRVCLQHYRSFMSRLLPAATALEPR